MNDFSKLTAAQKQTVLTQCRNMMGLPEQAVEKDYWVTVMLQMIFDSELGEHLIFKGGTSLSKNGNLIDRFSEDIDLAVNYTFLGIEGEPTKKLFETTMQEVEVMLHDYCLKTISPKVKEYIRVDEDEVQMAAEAEADYGDL